MDFGQVIYVIVIVLYFIYRAVAKKKGEEVTSEEESDSIPPKKGPSFEELLKEIREAQLPSLPELPKSPLPEPKPIVPVFPTVPEVSTEKKIMEPVLIEVVNQEQEWSKRYESSREAEIVQTYPAFATSVPEEARKKWTAYDNLPEKVNPYAELLKNPKSLKDAVVVSELLKRKHF
ncbi:MAG: hypothetical protein ACK5BR_02545 [Bacteroidota bacterium]|jgi:hypothetical protein|nr:hypothetical protein [Algoriphagus sp.]